MYLEKILHGNYDVKNDLNRRVFLCKLKRDTSIGLGPTKIT
jgi:hypothetical protein